MTGLNWNNIIIRLVAALVAAALVFALIYTIAWTILRSAVVCGDYGDAGRLTMMKNDFLRIRIALSDFNRQHDRYPQSLDDLPDFKDWRLRDRWKHPYHYSRTETGFRLLSLGRDGKPGGLGLDADIDSEVENTIRIDPTFSQFLWEGVGSATLLWVALIASLCALLACYRTAGPRGWPIFMREKRVLSVVATAVTAVLAAVIFLAIWFLTDR